MPFGPRGGDLPRAGDDKWSMAEEIAHDVTVDTVPDAGHRIAEENPAGLVETLRRFDTSRTG